MNAANNAFIQKHIDILSFRDLAFGTVSSYVLYLMEFLEWTEKELPGKTPDSVSYEEIRSYLYYLKDIRGLNSRTVNVHIVQFRDFLSVYHP